MKDKISQSLMKDVREFLNKELCGTVLERKWITDDYPDEPSDEMALGSYFEYLLTGALPKSGQIPRPLYKVAAMKAVPKGKNPWDLNELGKPILSMDDMYAEYKLAHVNAERIAGYLKKMGITIIEAGKRVTKGKFQGLIDVIAKWTFIDKEGRLQEILICIDIKYSGMINERWNKHGWVWTEEQRAYHGTQAKQYHYLTGLPFYFLVCSSKNDIDVKFIHVTMNEFTVSQHLVEGRDALSKLKLFQKTGFTPYPDLIRCAKCPIGKTCKDRAEYPVPQEVDLSIPD